MSLPLSKFHQGIPYTDYLKQIHQVRPPSNYLQIGVETGATLALAHCRTVAIDPHFQLRENAFDERAETYLFQLNSDDFFSRYNLEQFLPGGVDFAFLDGMHHFECLLRDFINVEKYSHKDTIVALHDCYPVNSEIATRDLNLDCRVDAATRLWWAGDVWKLLPILRDFRPDLEVAILDCPPTGLIIVRSPDRNSRALINAYDEIIGKYQDVNLEEFQIERFREEFPTTESRSIFERESMLRFLKTGTRRGEGRRASDDPSAQSAATAIENTAIFRNRNDICVLSLPKEPRKYLILIRAGSDPRPTFFDTVPAATRHYDIGVNYYAPPHPEDIMVRLGDLVCAGGLSKMHGAKLLMEASDILTQYEGVLFLDDDLELQFDPDQFFAVCQEYNLDLAQPALSPECNGFPITKQHPGLKLRTTNWVEVMAPYMKRDFLKEMAHSFDLSISGWGLDIYWGFHLGAQRTAAVLDEFVMKHTKEIDVADGGFYKYLRSIGISPYVEKRNIFSKLELKEYVVHPIKFVWYNQVLRYDN